MKLIQNLLFVAVASLSGSWANAAPVVLDFNAAASGYLFGSVVEDGFKVTGAGSYFMSLGGARYCGPACPDNNTNNLLAQGATFTVAAVDGSAFSMLAFEGAEAHMNNQVLWAKTLHLVGNKTDGSSVTADLVLDFINDGPGSAVDFQKFLLPSDFSNLKSVVFSGAGGSNNWFTLDNIEVSKGVTALQPSSQVPEPGSLLLTALAGLALLGAGRRRTAR